ncbi:CDP-alcohol phosphatidyltransferase family protein [Aspergillus fischeri NRRL 181]|uniref:CDP-diacylglycerol--inositol 3-phosphatidyltransferase n=1 Tax=Neosartorya fischeri (strain ATCC 1020 / DSM 3700 / CBS 544.65 / FGSC A1164 / JCM 1740 / NRRL 181 / WB 181) TaxID=331117 RepID=A1DBH6_NEOFI|nr:phosphatidylinositol synthase [Aspergillus fischeri NRRL 181]EAW20216.1 phosphatidylinositol synthase [Aspergillus fischeri NRRL 181]
MLPSNTMSTHPNNQKTVNENEENVFLFVPNLIGYTRIIFAIASLYYMPYHPRTCSLLYSISYVLDALDGAAARHLGQSTRFGAVLDMITDRCTTTCLLVFLASAFPRWSISFQALISLDYSSHYIHMYATLAMGGQTQSHKNIDESRPWVMRTYYSNQKVLFTVCTMNEAFFIALYLLAFSSPSMPWLWLTLSSPLMLFKQYVNVVQLVEASRWLARGDVEMRRDARLLRAKTE